MDRATLQQHLATAERHVADGERYLARQEEIIAELDRDGHDTRDARQILATMRATQTLHRQDVERLLKQLDQLPT
jgi:hypothetical protein